MKTDVVIVGAGPTGLALACQFVRYGVDFVVIEKNTGVTPYSKAIGVQARTLELYEQLGIAKDAVEEGAIGRKDVSWWEGKSAVKWIFQLSVKASAPTPLF